MAHAGALDEAAVLEVARAVGLDTARLASDMARPEVNAVIGEARALARALGINGTPAFIVGDVLLPGFVKAADLVQAVATARRAAKAR